MLIDLRRPKFLTGIILIIAGLDICILLSKLPRLAGILFIIAGALLILIDWRQSKSERRRAIGKKPDEKMAKRPALPSLSERLMNKLTLNGRLNPYLWMFGILVIAADLVINHFQQIDSIGSFDLVVMAFGVSLILYNWMVEKHRREMDFVLLFLGLLIIILVIPLWVSGVLGGNSQGVETEENIVNILLTRPLGGILTLLGISNNVNGAYVSWTSAGGSYLTVGIAASCAGIYSLGIFLSAFIAFILSEFSFVTRRLIILLGVGVACTYLANLFRMTIVIMAGYYNGIGDPANPVPFTLVWVHEYAGEIIFIAWVALFWYLTFRYFAPSDFERGRTVEPPKDRIASSTEKDRTTQESPNPPATISKSPVTDDPENK